MTDRARRLGAVDPGAPLAAVTRVDNAERLVGLDAAAARLGLTVGLSLADARARHPALVVVEANPAEEARLLERICDWCSRYTPLAALDRPDGLMLDISGVAHLFGGEAGLIEDARGRLAAQGLTVLAGVGSNPRAAWALARFSAQKVAPDDLTEKAFAKLFHDLPLAALGLDPKTVADMARAGLRRIGDVAMRPRAPITARFGPLPVARLDELRGLARSSIAPRFPPPDFLAERRFASPIATLAAIELSLRKLADDLVVLLERQAKGARRVELSLYRVDGAVRRVAVGASRPVNEARAIVRLFAERLASPEEDAIDAGFGVDLMRLACLVAEPLAPSQSEIERAHEAERARALSQLIDRLSARLGARAVTRREPVEAHLPERAEAATPAIAGEGRGGGILLPLAGGGDRRSGSDEGESAAPSRPLRLFVRPEPIEAMAEVPDGPPLRFRWRRVLHDVAAIEGPERIAPPWWRRDGGPTRDYFRAEDSQGRRFWLYREGLLGRETQRAKWFMHGVFG
ncbi:protein ImuB [Roseiarcus fermentans]|uniref:DNA-directed DNA polymerase n=2 Tax=Roseiarcus fermentans TaxID=1473586 RepID=A0A366FCK5_9HYPH|nr:protein ImuB [Roseiarcus fermentans]